MIRERNKVENASIKLESQAKRGLLARVFRARTWATVTAVVVLLGMAKPCLAQMGGIVTVGTATFGSSNYTYAVVIDSSTSAGYYIRVWLGGDRVMQLWPSEQQGQFLLMNYHIYRTMGDHWTLQGGADRTRSWWAESAGEIQLDGNTIPTNTVGILTGSISGRGRKTYRAHNGSGVKWYPVTETWWGVRFTPTNVNWPLFRQWQAAVQNPRRPQPPQPPQPPKKGLKNVTVNQHQVVVRMWDHAKEDGDIVDLYLNGQYLRRISLTNGGSNITLTLAQGNHRFQVRALNEGTDKPNTASIHVSGVVKGDPQQSWSMKTGQQTEMGITVQL